MPEKSTKSQLKNILQDALLSAILNPKSVVNSFPMMLEVTEHGDVIWYEILDFEKKILKPEKKRFVISRLMALSLDVIQKTPTLAMELGSSNYLSQRAASDFLEMVESRSRDSQNPRCLPLSPRPVGGNEDFEEWCLFRAPTTLKGSDEPMPSCQFLDSVFANLANDTMRTILKCFIARVYLGRTSSRQLLYWYGPGADGKSALLSFLVKTMGYQGVCFPYSYLENSFAAESYGDKRFLFIEEADKGNFFTGQMKAITGTEFVQVNPKGISAYQTINNLIIAIASNHKPACNGEPSEVSRLRYIESLEDPFRKALKAEEIERQLGEVWWPFVEHCIEVYKSHNHEIPENDETTYQDLVEGRFQDLDVKIESYLKYAEGKVINSNRVFRLSKLFKGPDFMRRLQKLVPKGRPPIRTFKGVTDVGREILVFENLEINPLDSYDIGQWVKG